MNLISFQEAMELIDHRYYKPRVFIKENGYIIRFLTNQQSYEYEINFKNGQVKLMQSFEEVRSTLRKLGYTTFHIQDDVPLDDD